MAKTEGPWANWFEAIPIERGRVQAALARLLQLATGHPATVRLGPNLPRGSLRLTIRP
jgi:hypothetical protein